MVSYCMVRYGMVWYSMVRYGMVRYGVFRYCMVRLIIAAPMCHLFNSSLRDSYITTIRKSANICPLTKTKPIQDICKDLQPISLTPVWAKMLEQNPVNHMRETCQNVDSSPFGVVTVSSTTLALLEI